MGFILASLVALAMLFLNYNAYDRLVAGRELNRLQKNIANNYLKVSAQFGKTLYFWTGVIFFAFMTIAAILINAWLSMLIFPGYWFAARRFQRLLDQRGYVAKTGALAVGA